MDAIMIASRTLKVREADEEVDLPIRIYAPRQDNGCWACRIEIDWPDEPMARDAYGHDSAQALHHGLQMVGIHLYVSGYHEDGLISFLEPGFKGYGFPVTKNVRDIAHPDDAFL
ncbi:conserved hypothetical protein [Azorhizobium caulinodans ORS 571]|uniref:DUF6968 domain-containing protein n=2 Tax=Azorhizobium caulinodans TaxID=7 RepID=A8IEN1_AZOC5|nr:conserved hypothetical protein [Azorhizobium caulinodans ORS 571]